MGRSRWADVSELVGQTIAEVDGGLGSDKIDFTLSDGRRFSMFHYQDCCENVSIEDICGDLKDLVGSPLTMAECVQSDGIYEGLKPGEYDDSFTWTFYRFATAKGYVTIRWYGTSNGYYSETVDFCEEITN